MSDDLDGHVLLLEELEATGKPAADQDGSSKFFIVSNGQMTSARAKRIIKAYLVEHRLIKFSYDTLRPLVPGCVGKQFTNVMTEIKLLPDFNGGCATAEYVGPRREVHALPDRVLDDTHEAEVYLGIKGGNNTLDGLKHRFGSRVTKVVYRLMQKDVICRNGQGEYEINEAMHSQNGIVGRAKAGAVTSALLDYLQENASEHPIPNAQIIGALTLRGFNKGSVNARLAEFKKGGLATVARGMAQYAGRDGQAETCYSGRVNSIGDVFDECHELGDRIKGCQYFCKQVIDARKSIPPAIVGLFYKALLKTPADDANQGARYDDILPVAHTEGAFHFMRAVASAGDLTGQEYDALQAKHGIPVGYRWKEGSSTLATAPKY